MAKTDRQQERRRLTPRQLQILTFIRDVRHKAGYSPTMQEIADELDVSKVTVFEHVEALIKKKLLRRLPHKARSLELTDRAQFPDQGPAKLRLVGRIAAGCPIEAIQDSNVLDLEALFAQREGTFVLQVDGDSMINDHIADGDYVVVEPRDRVRNGEIVVALLANGDATLKRLYREKKGYRLQPANGKYKPLRVAFGDLQVQGVVTGVIRQY